LNRARIQSACSHDAHVLADVLRLDQLAKRDVGSRRLRDQLHDSDDDNCHGACLHHPFHSCPLAAFARCASAGQAFLSYTPLLSLP
jgi:hypothetical protein